MEHWLAAEADVASERVPVEKQAATTEMQASSAALIESRTMREDRATVEESEVTE